MLSWFIDFKACGENKKGCPKSIIIRQSEFISESHHIDKQLCENLNHCAYGQTGIQVNENSTIQKAFLIIKIIIIVLFQF
ncbi:hypothetical protein [Formosa haliotis]|uniref:hypothetical protein n=1 Tax=Formosa haliotis TaxID=1555194 RepID=UPI0008252075|nr:hypothetical protein [Formosa haliotis]